jgi:hypothetical protein
MKTNQSIARSAGGSGCALLALLLVACGGRASNVNGEQPPSSASGASDGAASNANGGNASSNANGGNASSNANGGNASSNANGDNASSNASGGNAGHSGSASSAGSGNQSLGGATAVPHAARACDAPSPRPRGGGYSLCTDGSLRRESAAACESALPRAMPDLPLVADECANDSDCTSTPHGFCAYGTCKYGCVNDDECPSNAACFCGDAIGVCIPAGCRSNADCPSEFPCTAFQAPGFATPDALSCQSPTDECVTDAQCNSLNPRVSCKVQDDHRICYRDQVG